MTTEVCITEMPISPVIASNYDDPLIQDAWRTMMHNQAWQYVAHTFPDERVKLEHGNISLRTKLVGLIPIQVLVMETTVHME